MLPAPIKSWLGIAPPTFADHTTLAAVTDVADQPLLVAKFPGAGSLSNLPLLFVSSPISKIPFVLVSFISPASGGSVFVLSPLTSTGYNGLPLESMLALDIVTSPLTGWAKIISMPSAGVSLQFNA